MRISDWSSDVCSSDLQFDLARWRIVAQLIDRRLCSPQMLFERGTFGRHGTEHKAAVTRYARYFSKADTGFRNAFVAIGQRIAHQVAGIRESPGKVGADKRFAISSLLGATFIDPGRTLFKKNGVK